MIVVSCGARGCLKFVLSLETWQTSDVRRVATRAALKVGEAAGPRRLIIATMRSRNLAIKTPQTGESTERRPALVATSELGCGSQR